MKGDIVDFEKACSQLEVRIDIEESNCDRTLGAQDRKWMEELRPYLQKVPQELERSHWVQESLDRLETKMNLDKLPYMKGDM